jgi:Ni2+-binding GTPase involved in maturation of urease and hydrogenase
MKSLKLSDYINVVKPSYVYLRLTPNNSIRNQSTYKIAKSIASIYRNLAQTIRKEDAKVVKALGREFLLGTKYSVDMSAKVAYYVYIEKKKVEFYFVIPRQYLTLIKEKISDSWTNITVKVVADMPSFSETATKYSLVYTKEAALSLATDRRNDDLLRSKLNVVDVMEEGDKVGVFYNFMPTSQFSWRSTYEATIRKVKRSLPTDRNKVGVAYALKTVVGVISALFDDVGDVLSGGKGKGKADDYNVLEAMLDALNGGKKISPATTDKAKATVLDTQIVVMSESADKLRQRNNARSLTQAFETVTEDNRLAPKPLRKPFKFTDYSIAGAEINKVGDEEAQNFIAIAGRDILERYNFIEKVETQETQVPDDLRKGHMRVGVCTYRGTKVMGYLTTDKEYKNLALVVIGPQRSGKTTLFGNLTKDAIDNGECVIIFDFIENCEMSSQVASLFPAEKVLNIECGDIKKAQGLGYNEVKTSDDPWTQYTNAKMQTTQLLDLINSVNTEDKRLAPKMERYLESAANVVFINGGSIKDVFNVLTSHNKRYTSIRNVPKVQREYLDEYIESLNELDEIDKKTGEIKGTRFSDIVGIIDRLSKLKHNPYMELMLQKSTEGNIDLVTEIEKNQLICIKMPEDMFNTDTERDIYTTYWISKVWLALQIRASLIPKDQRKTVNLIIDELYQVENTKAFLSSKLNRLSKFRLKPIVSCHYLDQLKELKKELGGANASYMLLSGCDKQNFRELEDNLKPFELESLLNLPEHHSMNLIKNKTGYGKFITKLPAPVGEKGVQ